MAKTLIGQQIQGRIERVACEPYAYTVEETGEVVQLSHRYEYFPDTAPSAVPMHVVREGMVA